MLECVDIQCQGSEFLMKAFLDYRKKLRQKRWDKEYGTGKWEYMQSIEELGRYSAIMGYCRYLKARSVLDVGCGDGNLATLLPGLDAYIGIDISAIALRKGQNLADINSNYCFVEADFDVYVPSSTFDLIVFNESLYYSKSPLQTLIAYQKAMSSEGFIAVSMYKNLRAAKIWDMINETFETIDETHVQQRNAGWICRLLVPKHRACRPYHQAAYP